VFLEKKVANPLTGEILTGPFYPEGSSWDSTFGKIASNYEECRAECCGLYLSLEKEVLDVFGHEDAVDGQVHDITYINWLLMVRAGLTGLEFYTPETEAWRQAHMNARYVILRVLLEAGQGLVKLETTTGDDGEPNVDIHLDRDLIATVGKKAIGNFLLKLQIYKSVGDFENGSKMFSTYSEVPEDMAALRTIVMARKEPRKLLVQPHMSMADDGKTCTIKEFAETPEGMIESFAARFPAEDPELWALYEAEAGVMEGQ
jgi:dipeptidyl-peptidase-3